MNVSKLRSSSGASLVPGGATPGESIAAGSSERGPGEASSNRGSANRASANRAALVQLETPRLRWKVVAQIAGAFAAIWLTAFLVVPYLGYWGVGVSGLLTVVALGFGVYVWRLTRKSTAIVDILRTATDAKGRQEALARLQADGKPNDAMNALAQAQLMASDDPQGAVAILESIDLKKAPTVLQDDVRANLALLYLALQRLREARALVDQLQLHRQPQPKAKAMYAAVMAEAFARTGNAVEAKTLLETYRADDGEYAEVRPLLLRAQVYTYTATKNRGLAQNAMAALAAIDPMLLAPFTQRGINPELANFARAVLSKSGVIPKAKMRMRAP